MGRLRSWIERLERDSRDEQIVIPQQDGSVARFGTRALEEGFLHEANRLRAIHRGEAAGQAHALTAAKRGAMYPQAFTFDADEQPRRSSQAE